MTILDKIVASTRTRVIEAEREVPLERVRDAALAAPTGEFPFELSLRKPGLSFICEVKKASPSKGVIAEHFPYLEIARDYAVAGADAISVLTEPEYFLGSGAYLREITREVAIPALRKDFTVTEYQVYESKLLGASAILLIAAILSDAELERFRELAESLGLSALVETRSEPEVKRALAAGARIVGVNARDLRTFEVDLGVIARLRQCVPESVTFVAESGIRVAADVRALESAHPDAALIGEAFMLAPDKSALMQELRGAAAW
ncbi:MAG: indole-3-glycerol phosphate synthase TrpC [Oscillospiraceae bacterium]|jgi:indole-3-glycerol phosphate synthase|nr:indole-3-glycerol phosphate synthase TrpC [Oscillospiraceae bacterium]